MAGIKVQFIKVVRTDLLLLSLLKHFTLTELAMLSRGPHPTAMATALTASLLSLTPSLPMGTHRRLSSISQSWLRRTILT